MAVDFSRRTVQKRSGAVITDVAYCGGRGMVTATLVEPSRPVRGKRPALLFLHCAIGNRHEFLEEAVALTASGVVSLLPDAPPRRDVAEEWAVTIPQAVTDARHGIDVLSQLPVVDPTRIAVVGHGYGAQTAATVAATDSRTTATILMSITPSALDDLDAIHRLGTIRRNLFLQFAQFDEFIAPDDAARYEAAAPACALVKWYGAGHELGAQARRDRADWLSVALQFILAGDSRSRAIAAPNEKSADPRAMLGVVLQFPGMEEVRRRRDIQFATGRYFDCYYPCGAAEKLPVVILVHDSVPRRYRLVTTAAQLLVARARVAAIAFDGELDALLAYVREHAEELALDADRIGLWVRGSTLAEVPPFVNAVAVFYGSAPRAGCVMGGRVGFDYLEDCEESAKALRETIAYFARMS